ncbi:hypothetical protein [Pseudomonas aeruginosa]|uniref:hypothetical protein n=1 Tax=Pseudomonas aeruginosa TaxID=287 RepID=UPI0028806EFA|nr:hypothetical protein [Pseudomonas aeruginosa]
MSIDWSKAPEGATHWEPTGPEFHEGWMKKEGDYWFYWVEGTNKWFHGPSCNVSAERAAKFEARPQEAWDGQGLPPVGTGCEVKNDISDSWDAVDEILAHTVIKGTAVAVFKRGDHIAYSPKSEFRPIRTPEQIAAEERSKECDRIFFILSNVEREGNRSDMAEAIYDAGYRRQESST